VWATLSRNDIIHQAVRPKDVTAALIGTPTDALWYGTDPVAPAFGANVFTSDPGRSADPIAAHTTYFDDGNPALVNIARIAVSDSADVS
jgi:hypothetical protein